MFANIGDLTSNVISSEKNLPLQRAWLQFRYILDSSWKQHRWCLQCVFTIIELIPHASDLLATMNFQFNVISDKLLL